MPASIPHKICDHFVHNFFQIGRLLSNPLETIMRVIVERSWAIFRKLFSKSSSQIWNISKTLRVYSFEILWSVDYLYFDTIHISRHISTFLLDQFSVSPVKELIRRSTISQVLICKFPPIFLSGYCMWVFSPFLSSRNDYSQVRNIVRTLESSSAHQNFRKGNIWCSPGCVPQERWVFPAKRSVMEKRIGRNEDRHSRVQRTCRNLWQNPPLVHKAWERKTLCKVFIGLCR